jgi:hypothetical protein
VSGGNLIATTPHPPSVGEGVLRKQGAIGGLTGRKNGPHPSPGTGRLAALGALALRAITRANPDQGGFPPNPTRPRLVSAKACTSNRILTRPSFGDQPGTISYHPSISGVFIREVRTYCVLVDPAPSAAPDAEGKGETGPHPPQSRGAGSSRRAAARLCCPVPVLLR